MTMTLFGWLQMATLPWMVVLCIKDWRIRRLPNVWVLPMGVVALLIRWMTGGLVAGLFDGLIGGALCGAFLLVPFLAHRAGAGDVKLLFVCGCWLGVGSTMLMLILTSFAGFVLALGFLCCCAASRLGVLHVVRCLFDRHYDRKAGREALQQRPPEAGRVPFAIAIAVGFYGTILLEGGLL
jgi:prepilin peptidase CpaA